MDSDQRMIVKQAELITKLHADYKELRLRMDRLERENDRLRAAAAHWKELQEQVCANPTLQAEWERFLMMLKMAADPEYLRKVGA